MAAMPLDPYSFLKQGHLSGGLFTWFTKSHYNSCEATKGFPLCAFVSFVVNGFALFQLSKIFFPELFASLRILRSLCLGCPKLHAADLA
jgi:hypothetical protein